MRNGCVARDFGLRQGARRENILYGSLTDEQRRRSPKDRATLRAKLSRAAGGVAPQSKSASAMLLRHALPAARQNLAQSFPILRWVWVLERIARDEENFCKRGTDCSRITPTNNRLLFVVFITEVPSVVSP